LRTTQSSIWSTCLQCICIPSTSLFAPCEKSKHVWSMDGQHLLTHLSVSFIPSANISFSTTKVVHHKLYKLLEQWPLELSTLIFRIYKVGITTHNGAHAMHPIGICRGIPVCPYIFSLIDRYSKKILMEIFYERNNYNSRCELEVKLISIFLK
jgi:hypothetical protein